MAIFFVLDKCFSRGTVALLACLEGFVMACIANPRRMTSEAQNWRCLGLRVGSEILVFPMWDVIAGGWVENIRSNLNYINM